MATAPTAAGIEPAGAGNRAPVRVMVVDDSVVIRGLVGRWVDEEDGLELVAKCANGGIALEAMADARPDVIILDIEMPVMDGLAALPGLLGRDPRPQVIVASTLTRRNAALALKALSNGAAECLSKPDTNSAVSTSVEFRRDLIAKVRVLGGLDPLSPPARGRSAPRASADYALVPYQRGVPKVVAVGSSTGGPRALARVLADAGAGLARVPVFVTQHMPPTFTAMLAENLGRAARRPAREAGHGEVPRPGHIYVAPGGHHLVFRRGAGGGVTMALDERPPVNFTRPSVDVMLESAARVFGRAALGVILTGMGRDGVAGAAALREAGGNIIAQDQATSAVWGMPGATARTGVCSAVLPIDRLGAEINRLVAGGGA